jgi:hypothetical protein
MNDSTRCEADTYNGTVCRGTLRSHYRGDTPRCAYASSHLRTLEEPYVRRVSASPSDPWHVIGRAVLIAPTEYHEMSQYPGADRMLKAPEQTVLLTSNGYYCAYQVVGEITGRGYYGGEIGVTETYTCQPYAYEVVTALTERAGMNRGNTVRYELMPGVDLRFENDDAS